MKRLTLIIAVLAVTFGTALAQGGRNQSSMETHRTEIQNLKIAFMTKELNLTPSESEKFWPVYNLYWEEKVNLAKQKRDLCKKIDGETATQSDIDGMVKLVENEARIMAKYAAEIAKVTSTDKAAKTFVAEDKFKGTLLRHNTNRPTGKTQGVPNKK